MFEINSKDYMERKRFYLLLLYYILLSRVGANAVLHVYGQKHSCLCLSLLSLILLVILSLIFIEIRIDIILGFYTNTFHCRVIKLKL